MKKCFVCGNQAHFWIDLGDFVVGYSPRQTVCRKCLSGVLEKCVYQSEKWKHQPRFWTLSEADRLPQKEREKIKRIFDEEFKRCFQKEAKA